MVCLWFQIGKWNSKLKKKSLIVNPHPKLIRPKEEKEVQNNRTLIVTSIVVRIIDFHAYLLFYGTLPNFPHFQTSPYLIRKEGNFVGNDQYEGYCADLAKQIGNYLHRDYLIVPVHDGKYGAVNDNGTWDGMVGELVSNVSSAHNKGDWNPHELKAFTRQSTLPLFLVPRMLIPLSPTTCCT